jgi:hypothetical protein
VLAVCFEGQRSTAPSQFELTASSKCGAKRACRFDGWNWLIKEGLTN